MTEQETQKNKPTHSHGTPGMTRWVHHHKRLAKWIIKGFIAAATALVYYLRGQEKKIDKEAQSDRD